VTARTPSAAAALPTARRSGYLLSVATTTLLLSGVALASPAGAVDDPTKPDARVTNGPSCHAGGVVVEVIGGTVGYDVTLATTRTPGGEDAAEVGAGETVVLRTGGVAWGETIDGRLEFTALDGSGTSFVDELDGYTFTRPAEEDCAAIAAPTAAATVPPVEPQPDGGTVTPFDTAPDGATAGHEGPVAGADSAPTGVRPDGTRPGGTDTVGAGSAVPAKAEASSAAGVRVVETAAAPATVPASASLVPVGVAATALGAAAAGLAGVIGRSRRAGRRPTGSA
jgi:hypothetical protein